MTALSLKRMRSGKTFGGLRFRPEKQFLQGLIQVAVALHHHGKGNLAGARSLLARGTRNLTGYPEGFGGIQLVRLLESLEQWRNALAEGKPVPRLPQL